MAKKYIHIHSPFSHNGYHYGSKKTANDGEEKRKKHPYTQLCGMQVSLVLMQISFLKKNQNRPSI
jgi:hypothetical protein